MRILIDLMGADKAPGVLLKGAALARSKTAFEAVFLGDKNEITNDIKEVYPYDHLWMESEEKITNEDEPAMAIRRKKKSSMVLGFHALKNDEADAMLSAGNTGALLAGATLIVGRLPGVDRAALTIILPGVQKPTILLDAGANMDISPELMRQFAIMGSIYAQNVLKRENPTVGLLNVGSERGKGNQLTKGSEKLLETAPIHFYGNIEARDLLESPCDVIVCDGFAGNVALKTLEGVSSTLMTLLKDKIMSSTRGKLGGLLIKPALMEVKATLDYREFGSAPLLGAAKPIFKAHGSSDEIAIMNGILNIKEFYQQQVNSKILSCLEEKND